MKRLHNLFLSHPASVGETYGEHLLHAASFGARLALYGCTCVVHAVLPFILTNTASNGVARLYDEMIVQRRRQNARAATVR